MSIEKKKDKLFYYYDRLKQNAQLSTMSSLPVKDNKQNKVKEKNVIQIIWSVITLIIFLGG